jgi:hypothetical protein
MAVAQSFQNQLPGGLVGQGTHRSCDGATFFCKFHRIQGRLKYKINLYDSIISRRLGTKGLVMGQAHAFGCESMFPRMI